MLFRSQIELEAAARVAHEGGAAEWRTVTLDLAALGGSSLTDDLPVPKDRAQEDIGQGVPSTYVPARNTVFLSVALARPRKGGALLSTATTSSHPTLPTWHGSPASRSKSRSPRT